MTSQLSVELSPGTAMVLNTKRVLPIAVRPSPDARRLLIAAAARGIAASTHGVAASVKQLLVSYATNAKGYVARWWGGNANDAMAVAVINDPSGDALVATAAALDRELPLEWVVLVRHSDVAALRDLLRVCYQGVWLAHLNVARSGDDVADESDLAGFFSRLGDLLSPPANPSTPADTAAFEVASALLTDRALALQLLRPYQSGSTVRLDGDGAPCAGLPVLVTSAITASLSNLFFPPQCPSPAAAASPSAPAGSPTGGPPSPAASPSAAPSTADAACHVQLRQVYQHFRSQAGGSPGTGVPDRDLVPAFVDFGPELRSSDMFRNWNVATVGAPKWVAKDDARKLIESLKSRVISAIAPLNETHAAAICTMDSANASSGFGAARAPAIAAAIDLAKSAEATYTAARDVARARDALEAHEAHKAEAARRLDASLLALARLRRNRKLDVAPVDAARAACAHAFDVTAQHVEVFGKPSDASVAANATPAAQLTDACTAACRALDSAVTAASGGATAAPPAAGPSSSSPQDDARFAAAGAALASTAGRPGEGAFYDRERIPLEYLRRCALELVFAANMTAAAVAEGAMKKGAASSTVVADAVAAAAGLCAMGSPQRVAWLQQQVQLMAVEIEAARVRLRMRMAFSEIAQVSAGALQ
jgi:hypothetical protein